MEIDLIQAPKVHRDIGNRTEANRQIARRFGMEFFDGARVNGYGGYHDAKRSRPVALRMMLHYGLWSPDSVLDVGCAKGFLVNDLYALGLTSCGIDISAYAISCASGHAVHSCSVGNATTLDFPDKEFALAVSITTIHNLERDECAQALKELVRVSKHQYVTLDAYRNDEERKRMEAWNLTAKTMMSCDEWVKFFKEVGYTGDWGWFVP